MLLAIFLSDELNQRHNNSSYASVNVEKCAVHIELLKTIKTCAKLCKNWQNVHIQLLQICKIVQKMAKCAHTHTIITKY